MTSSILEDPFSLPWLDRLSFASESQPVTLFELRYDSTRWRAGSAFSPVGLGYQLIHRSIPGCSLAPTTGGNTSHSMTVESFEIILGGSHFVRGRAEENNAVVFVTYCTADTQTATCFIAYPGSDATACLVDVETVLATLAFVPNPVYTVSPYTWTCRDEQDNPGLCQISYTLPLNAFTFSDTSESWAVGDDGYILHWDRASWSQTDGRATTALYAVSFTDPAHGWAAGSGGLILRWDGSDWLVDMPYSPPGQSPGGSTRTLYALDFLSPGDGWAAGAYSDPGGHVLPLLLHWGGTVWQSMSGLPTCQACGLNAVLAISAQDVWVAGGSHLGGLLWHWDGAAWQDFPVSGASWLYSLASGSGGELWAAGLEQGTSPEGVPTQRGAILQWDGTAWEPLILPPNSGGFYAVAALPNGDLVVGGDVTLLRHERAWAFIATEIQGYGWIADLELAPDGSLYALTRSGHLFKLTP